MFNNKKILVVIPARSGSKGIKNKNIKKINGKHLIYYTINYAQKSKVVDKIIVSTDSKKYAKISNRYGVETPFLRSKHISRDTTKDFPVIIDALRKTEKFFKLKFDYVIILRPTSPKREKMLIEKGIKILDKNNKADSVRAVTINKYHPFRYWRMQSNGFMKSFIKTKEEPYNIPRQKLPLAFFQSGDIEIVKRKTLLNGSVTGKKVLPLIIKRSFDLDTIDDIKNFKKKT